MEQPKILKSRQTNKTNYEKNYSFKCYLYNNGINRNGAKT